MAGLLAGASALAWWAMGPEGASIWGWRAAAEGSGGEAWRWWSAALVHLNTSHLHANLWAAAVTAAWGRVAGAGPAQTLAWMLAWPLTHALLITDPGSVTRYAGLSATLHAGTVIVCWHLILHHKGARRAVGGAVSCAMGIKLALEVPLLQTWWRGGHAAGQALTPLSDAPGHVVAGHAHGCGVVAGLVAVAIVDGIMGAYRLRLNAATVETQSHS